MKKGFTIIELIVVLLILGLLIAIAAHFVSKSATNPPPTPRVDTVRAQIVADPVWVEQIGLYDTLVADPSQREQRHVFSPIKPDILDGHVDVRRYRPKEDSPETYWFVTPAEATTTTSQPEK